MASLSVGKTPSPTTWKGNGSLLSANDARTVLPRLACNCDIVADPSMISSGRAGARPDSGVGISEWPLTDVTAMPSMRFLSMVTGNPVYPADTSDTLWSWATSSAGLATSSAESWPMRAS